MTEQYTANPSPVMLIASPLADVPNRIASNKTRTIEYRAALGLLVLVLFFMAIRATHAGGLWRDEATAASIALKPFSQLPQYLQRDSSPAAWPILLRLARLAGLTSDTQIRLLGFLIGTILLVLIWVCSQRIGIVPLFSLGLLAVTPAFVVVATSCRAYGLGMCFIVLLFTQAWRVAQSRTDAGLLWLAAAALGCAHCLYQNSVIVAAVLPAAAAIRFRRNDRRGSASILAIGLAVALSMLLYVPAVQRESGATLLCKTNTDIPRLFNEMAAALSSAPADVAATRPAIWVWLALCIAALCVATARQWSRLSHEPAHAPQAAPMSAATVADRALFCGIALVIAIPAYLGFLLYVSYQTQSWHYTALTMLVALALDGLLSPPPHALRWQGARVTLIAAAVACAVPTLWTTLRARATNVDLVAQYLTANAQPADLIIVDPFYCGWSFTRYYSGSAPWTTVPPVSGSDIQHYDEVKLAMLQHDPLRPLLNRVRSALQQGHRVWVVGSVALIPPDNLPPAPPLPPLSAPYFWNHQPYSAFWTAQLGEELFVSSNNWRWIPQLSPALVNSIENMPLAVFFNDRLVQPAGGH